MKKTYTPKILFGLGILFSGFASAQCPTITCPSNITVNNDSTSCGAAVTFSSPAIADPCAITTQTFVFTGSLQTFTVPAGVTSLNMTASGAQGGSVTTNCAATGGLGARMQGDFAVTPGEVLSIMVGEQGLTNGSDAGGGGGTFIVRTGNIALLVAGGGGGATNNIGGCGSNRNGLDATITTSGTASGNGVVAGGINGNGGGASGGSGGGGGGFLTDGVAGMGLPGNNGKSYLNGGAGGNGNNNDRGGYGGGGAGWFTGGNGGGGGGYSGGATSGSQPFTGGGGGGSYNIGTNQVNTAGAQTGNGSAILTYAFSSTITQTQIAGLASGSSFPVGTTVQTFVVDDGSGNTDTCSFTVTVNDTQAPTILCPSNITVNTDSGMCSAVVTYAPVTTIDNCSIDSTYLSAGLSSGSAFPVGTTTVSYTTIDASGNSVSCSFDITVTDNQAPAFACPGNMAVNADSGMCSAVVNYSAPVATDNCNLASNTMTGGLASGSTFPLGATTITYTAMDSAGNSSTCSFDIVVSDNQAPVMACPGTMTVPSDSGNCSAIVTFNAPSATDNCSSASVAQTGGPASGSAFPVGTTTITYTATDSAGNFSTCSFDIIVTDNEAPLVLCVGNVTTCDSIVVFIGASASDACSGVGSLTYTLSGATTGSGTGDASGTVFNVGATLVTYTATDSAGNSANCSFTVTVNPPPFLAVGSSSNMACLSDAPVTLSGAPTGGTWSGPGVTGSALNPASAGVGVHTATYTYTDSSGCTNSAGVIITVNACVGVTEIAGINGLQVYPNPTQGNLQIVLGAEYAKVDLRIAQINGQIVQQEQFSKTSSVNMSLENLATGIYFLTINADDQVKTVKLIKN
ncbi:MAG: Hyalin [Bacteroidetes bacterium]|nr:MAG: Hyalin [Bacteroidota bacterium]